MLLKLQSQSQRFHQFTNPIDSKSSMLSNHSKASNDSKSSMLSRFKHYVFEEWIVDQ
jgi:hypothetical protein